MNNFIRRSRGFTLIEVMVAMVLGLILIAAVGVVYLRSSDLFRAQRGLADVQDSGRFALWILREDFARAGWTRDPTLVVSDYINFTAHALCANAACTYNGAGTADDSILVRYEGVTDCAGSNVNAGNFGTVENRYFVANRVLFCSGSGGAGAQPLISNVDSFQLMYGIDSNGDRIVDMWANATDVVAEGHQQAIRSIRIALLVGADELTSSTDLNHSYQVLDVTRALTADKYARRLFSITVTVENMI